MMIDLPEGKDSFKHGGISEQHSEHCLVPNIMSLYVVTPPIINSENQLLLLVPHTSY